jgi:cell division septum initiation protein DivIVA
MKEGTKGSDLSVDEVFNRVLAAEQEAREAVAACRLEADAIIARGEREARRIARRADRRMRNAHAIVDRSIERALAELQRPAAAGTDAAPDPELVSEVAARLARELMGPPR